MGKTQEELFGNDVIFHQRRNIRFSSRPLWPKRRETVALTKCCVAGVFIRDLTRIRSSVEQGAIDTFKARKSRKQYEELKAEKELLERTVNEQAADLALIKKSDRSG